MRPCGSGRRVVDHWWTLLSLFVLAPTVLCQVVTRATSGLITAGEDGAQQFNGYTMITNATGAAVLYTNNQEGTTMTTLTPGSLWVSGSFGGAGCVSFNFSADVPLDVFLSTKLDLVGMLDAEQEYFNGSKAKAIPGTTFKAAMAGQMLVNVSSNEDYVLAAIYTNASSPSDTNFNYFLGVYPQQSKACSAAENIGLVNMLPQQYDTYSAFEARYPPGYLSTVALITNATCVAFQLLGFNSVSQDQNVTLALVPPGRVLSYVDEQLAGGNPATPIPLGAFCQQSDPTNANDTTPGVPAGAIVTKGVSPPQPGQYPGAGYDVHINATQSCQMVNDNLNPSYQYYLLLHSDVPFENSSAISNDTLYPSKARVVVRSQGSCDNAQFPPIANATALLLTEISGPQNLVVNGTDIDSAVIAAPPANKSLSGGAIAGIVIGALVGIALLASLAFVVYRHRSRRRNKQEEGAIPASQDVAEKEWRAYTHSRQPNASQRGLSTADAQPITLPAGAPAAPALQWQVTQEPWELDPRTIEYVTKPDGSHVVLGRLGTLGEVFLAKQNRTTTVVCKELQGLHDAATQQGIAARISDHLNPYNYTNIVTFLGACFKESKCMLVMEYLHGGSLREIRQHDVRLTMWRYRGHVMAIDMAKGLVSLHIWRNTTHRNLHSGNVLFTYGGMAKLADIAFLGEPDEQWMGLHQGRDLDRAWVPPELLKQPSEPYTAKSDVYGLGGCLYELLTSHDFADRARRPIRCPGKCPPGTEDCPIDVKELVMSCIAERPEDRPTADQVYLKLQELSSNRTGLSV